ncbi:MAG: hypothetical protein KAY83_01960, partial [Agitococcus sp.]|nr:hypothetical protein [Agitococcus sp.]
NNEFAHQGWMDIRQFRLEKYHCQLATNITNAISRGFLRQLMLYNGIRRPESLASNTSPR